MKISKLEESNELELRAKNHRKKQRGLSPFCSLNTNAGNVEHNVAMFNMMNSPVDSASTNPVSGPFGGESSGMCEDVETNYEYVLPYANEEDSDTQWKAARMYGLKYEEHSEKGGYIRLVGSKENLEKYCDAHGQDSADIKQVNESLEENVTLTYDSLDVDIVTRKQRPSNHFFEYDRDEAQTKNDTISYDYEVSKDAIVEVLYDFVDDTDMKTIHTSSDEEILKFIDSNFDDLFTKYQDKLLDHFRKDAKVSAEKGLNESFDSSSEYVIMGIKDDGTKLYYNVSSVPHWVDKGADATIFDDMDEARLVWFNLEKKQFKRVFIPVYDYEAMNEAVVPVDVDRQYMIDLRRDNIEFLMDFYVGKYYQTLPRWQDKYRVNTKSGRFILEVQFDTTDPHAGFVFSIDGKASYKVDKQEDAAKIIIDTARRKYVSTFDVAVESIQEDWTPPENWVSYKGAWIYPVQDGYEANFMGQHFEGATIDDIKIKLASARIHMQRFSGESEKATKFADNIKKFGRELTEDHHEATKEGILDWLEEHEQAYSDAQRFFGDMPLSDVERDDLVSWIEYHKLLYKDFVNFFNIDESWNPDLTDCPACGDVSFDSKKGRCTRCSYRESFDDDASSIKEWYEFSDDDVEDDLMHSAVYGGDSKYCKICGAVKEYDEDGFTFCHECSTNESFDFDDDDEGKTVSVSFDVNAPTNMKDSDIENIIRKAVAATDLDIPGYMEVHVLNEYLQEKLTGYKLTITKDDETFDDYACAYEEEGAIRQMKNKYGDNIEIVNIDDSRVIKESLTEDDTKELKAFLNSLLEDNVFENLNETDRKYAENITKKFLSKLNSEELTEASYGGAYDIADDQYFMKEDLVNCAEKVIEHLNETFEDTFQIADVRLEGPNMILEVDGAELGWYMEKCSIDMRKIRVPSDLTDKYALELASKLIAQIKNYNHM